MLETTEDWKALERFGKGLDAYRQASGRTLSFAVIKWAGELTLGLYRSTAKLTPSDEKLEALGGSTPSKHGRKGMWAIKRERGRAIDEIRKRQRHRFYSAAGWKVALRGFRGGNTVHSVVKRIGGVLAYITETGTARIEIINRTLAIEKLNREHSLVTQAVRRVFLNASSYIKRKLGEEAQTAFLKL